MNYLLGRLRRNRLVLQLCFIVLAAVSLTGISVVIIGDAIHSAESVVLGEANRALVTALNEMKQQQQYGAAADPSWSTLPTDARDISLRALTQTVLRSYPGVEGGFFSSDGDFLGYAYPTHDNGAAKTDVPVAERASIAALARLSLGVNAPVQRVLRGKVDLVALAAVRTSSGRTAVWVMKRLPGRAQAGDVRRTILLGVLILSALVSVAGSLATGFSLARGVKEIETGLGKLEANFDFRLPERHDELGIIGASINKMANSRTKLEADLRREDRLRALGRLAAGLAHELRNPLNSIRLTVQLMQNRLSSGRLRQEDLETVQAEVDRLAMLVNDLLDLQRTREPLPKLQRVLPVVEHCLTLLRRQAEMQGVSLRIASADPDLQAHFDAQQLTQTVMNLLLNALEASKEGCCVNMFLSERGGDVIVEVQDSGPGLDAEEQEHLFEPFFTTKPTGTGLGLAVSRELMRGQGGDLQYEGNRSGARFVVRLPRT